MNRKLVPALVLFTVLGAIALHSRTSNQTAAGIAHSSSSTSQSSVPDHIVYGFLFRNVARNTQRSLDLEAKGHLIRKYLPLKRELGFTEEQSHALIEIASECESQVAQQDKNAQLIIAQFRARLPNSTVAPSPPPELKTMWDERNAMILRARDRLRSALDADAFSRLDDFVKFRYGSNKAPVTLKPVESTSK